MHRLQSNPGMRKLSKSARLEFMKLAATFGVMSAIASVVGLVAWLSSFWHH